MVKEIIENSQTTHKVRVAPTTLTLSDHIGTIKARLGIFRMNYAVEPGLYAVGKPDSHSPVLVSSNYKLTFDILRRHLKDFYCWLLILDTKGVNVWCAAGKGTFGTDELINRIGLVELKKYVEHRCLILPQLGAPGVNARAVADATGFSVTFGPVRADDVQAFILAGNNATDEMRRVMFSFKDRLVLTPMEVVPAMKIALPAIGVLFITSQFARQPFCKNDLAAAAAALLTGAVLTPMLLPYIPGRAFSFKGWLMGACTTFGVLCLAGGFKPGRRLMSVGEMLLLPAVSSYLAMNFTGSSTYTSPSGVRAEMRRALPLIIAAGMIGAVIMLGCHFFGRVANGKT